MVAVCLFYLQKLVKMWQNRTQPNKTARVPYAYITSEEDPLVLIPETYPKVVYRLTDRTLANLNYNYPLAAEWAMDGTLQALITIFWKDQHSAAGSCIGVVTA